MALIAPSILSADFTRIGEAVEIAERAGADVIHVDIMDGHFVPNLTFGPRLVASLRNKTALPIDVHLMVENPRFFIPLFHSAGADWVSFHLEASAHLHKDITLIKGYGKRAGMALNPATPIHLLDEILPELDFVLLMTVNPGWGGQEFIESSKAKIANLKKLVDDRGLKIQIEIDGGVHLENMEGLIRIGADIIVSGSSIFQAENPAGMVAAMKALAGKFNR